MRPLRTVALLFVAACSSAPPPRAPSDDPDDYPVESGAYELTVGEPRWVVPSPALPRQVQVLPANNNLDIVFHEDRLFLVWRTAETHFASANARMYVVSSRDQGASWEYEHTIAIGADVREPLFLSLSGRLTLHHFEGGTNIAAFEPKQMWRTRRERAGRWTASETFGTPGEVPWDMKVRRGRAYLTSYRGNHYQDGTPSIEVLFRTSLDGLGWNAVAGDGVVYVGGVSEVTFELDRQGALFAVTRNEDGDETGFGSHVCTAPPGDLGAWDCPDRSDPERYDSPKLFRHGDEIYLIARRDVGGPYDQGKRELSEDEQRSRYQVDYWTRPKRTAIYRVDRTARTVVHLRDLPSAGDTAFPSVRRTGAHTFLVANYTSRLDDPDRSWAVGQTSSEGTQIYFVTLTFVKVSSAP